MRTAPALMGLIAAVAIAHAHSVLAHDLNGLVAERSSLDPGALAKIEEANELRRLLAARSKLPGNESLEAVVQLALRWPGGKVSVCFFDGNMSARDHVAGVTAKWSDGTGVSLDFGSAGARSTCDPARPSDVRVSFRGVGYWSYVGTQARLIDPNKQTLNLQGLDRAQFTENDDGIILHEFGHAIGFEHEHQSPVSGCEEEFNWSYLYTSMGWPKEQVDRNMRRLDVPSSKTGLLTTAFDSESNMLYSLAPEAFKDPAHAKCYIPKPNNAISKTDRQAAAKVYPSMSAAPAGMPAPAASEAGTAPDSIAAQSLKRLRELIEPGTP